MKKYLAEAMGTGLLAFTAISTSGNEFAIAGILAIAIYAYAGVSGAHFNLSVTSAMWSRGEISCTEAIKYGLAQIAGAIIAIAIAQTLRGEAAFVFGPVMGDIHPLDIFREAIASGILITAIFVCIRNTMHPAIGVALAHVVLVPMGVMLNTSITLGTFTDGGALLTLVVLAIAQISGGILASRIDKSLAN